MRIKLLAFGAAKDIFERREVELNLLEGSTVSDLRLLLNSEYPRLKELVVYRIAINGEYSVEDSSLQEGDEVAIIPPVSGG